MCKHRNGARSGCSGRRWVARCGLRCSSVLDECDFFAAEAAAPHLRVRTVFRADCNSQLLTFPPVGMVHCIFVVEIRDQPDQRLRLIGADGVELIGADALEGRIMFQRGKNTRVELIGIFCPTQFKSCAAWAEARFRALGRACVRTGGIEGRGCYQASTLQIRISRGLCNSGTNVLREMGEPLPLGICKSAHVRSSTRRNRQPLLFRFHHRPRRSSPSRRDYEGETFQATVGLDKQADAARFCRDASRLDERQRRAFGAAEAKVLGRGGTSQVVAATGIARNSVMAGHMMSGTTRGGRIEIDKLL